MEIDARTDEFFSEIDRQDGREYAQAVFDLILVYRGTRTARPDYGSLGAGNLADRVAIESSIQESLLTDSRTESVAFRVDGNTLTVLVNGNIEVAV